jgi:hypothetical protein
MIAGSSGARNRKKNGALTPKVKKESKGAASAPLFIYAIYGLLSSPAAFEAAPAM